MRFPPERSFDDYNLRISRSMYIVIIIVITLIIMTTRQP